MSKITRILITDASHPVTPSALKTLREVKGEKYYIVGVDIEKNAPGFLWTDSHYIVPPPNKPEYIEEILRICEKEHVELVIPWTNDEALTISKKASLFKKRGVALLCGSAKSIENVVDKGKLLQNLQGTDVPVPDFRLASTPKEVEAAAKNLGYPDKPVVIKPRSLSGTRGFCILDTKSDLWKRGLGNRLPLSAFLKILSELKEEEKANLDYLIMEFLPGDDYSVDTLCDQGKPLFMIPRLRLAAIGGVSHIGETTDNPEVREIVAKIIKHFNLHLNANVQVKYSQVNGGKPLVYDVNPRISGTIVANAKVGVNLLYYGIRLALGKLIPDPSNCRFQQAKMVRYWAEEYIRTKNWFKP